MVFDFCVPSQSVIKYRVILKNSDVVERHGNQRRLRRVAIPCNLYLTIK